MIQDKVLENIHEDEVVELTRQLIRCPSVNPPGNERECAEVLVQVMNELGLETRLMGSEDTRQNAVGILKGTRGSPKLLYNGHMDVVAPGPNWTRDPFGGEVVGDKIYGRGATDMKSALAAMVIAAKALVEAGVELQGDLIITGVIDEESLGPGGTRYLYEQGIGADMAIVGEPTDLRIEIAQRGVLWAEIETMGKAAHGGRPWLGVNAIYKMADVIAELRALEEQLKTKTHPLVQSPTFSLNIIQGGTRVNVVPDHCKITVDRRLIPSETPDKALGEIQAVLENLKAKDQEFQFQMVALNKIPPFELPKNSEIVQTLSKQIKQVRGKDPQITGKDAATDAYILNQVGIPAILCGPGTHQTAHTANEYAEIPKIVDAAKIYALMALEVLG